MHDRDDDEPVNPNDFLNELKTVTFLLSGVYKQLEAEREAMVLASGQMSQSVKQFAADLVKFAELDQQLQKATTKATQEALRKSVKQLEEPIAILENYFNEIPRLDERMRLELILSIHQENNQAADRLAARVTDTIAHHAKEKTERVLSGLGKIVTHAEAQLEEYRQALQASRGWGWIRLCAIALMAAFIGTILTHKFVPKQGFTEEQEAQLEFGDMLIHAWRGLDKQEQDKIIHLNKDNPAVRYFKWLK